MSERWYILGRGAIGLLFAAHLSEQSIPVTLIVKDQGSTGTKQQVILTKGELRQTFEVNLSHHSDTQAIDYLIVPLKAYDVLAAITQLKSRITPNTLVILCHNGMGTIEPVRRLLGKQQPILFATTTHGAYKKAQYHVHHTGEGETNIGWVSGHRPQLPAALMQLLPPVTLAKNIEAILWQKLAINCVINPITAIANCRNGELAKAQFTALIQGLCQEIGEVAQSAGIELSSQALIESCYKVIAATAANYSSMNRDFAAGRPSEIDFITGFLLQKAGEFGISTPLNQSLYDQLKPA